MEFDNLHQILRSLYDGMMPLCGDMADVARGIAGLGALFYVACRVWQSLARAEAIDVFPMLRPFAVGLCIMFFPTVVLGTVNSILSPVVQGTAKLLETQTLDMNEYRKQKDKLEYEAKVRNPETAYLVSNEEFDKQLEELGWSPTDMVTMAGMYIDRGMYNMKKNIRDFFREILELMFQAAALVIDTIRTFFLVVLAILGPIAFAISVWDGFQSTLTQWFCRYIQVYLWLPVSDIFSTILAKIQVLMLQSDIERMQADPNFSLDSSDGVYIVFMIIGIIGYFTIPTVAGWIIQAGGMGSYGRGVTQLAGRGAALAGGVAGAAVGNAAGRVGRAGINMGKAAWNHTAGRLLKRKYPIKSDRNGIQVTQEHRNIVQADTPVRYRLPRPLYRDNGLERVEFLPLCGAAEGKNLCTGQRQVADAGTLAGPFAEPSGRSTGTRAPLPRAFLHALT